MMVAVVVLVAGEGARSMWSVTWHAEVSHVVADVLLVHVAAKSWIVNVKFLGDGTEGANPKTQALRRKPEG